MPPERGWSSREDTTQGKPRGYAIGESTAVSGSAQTPPADKVKIEA